MTTLSRTRRLLTFTGAAILVASATVFGALPVHAAPGGESGRPASDKASYAALGDSYAAGVGGGDYIDACLLSPNGYAAQLASAPGVVHAALRGCTGATADAVAATQLTGLDHRTKFVSLTVGANDLGLDVVTAACLAGTLEQCAAAIAQAQANLAPLAVDLSATLSAVRAAAPNATVAVTGYPLLLDGVIPQAPAVNAGVIALNGVISAAVTGAGNGFVYVDVVAPFIGHGIGSADPWIVGPPELDAFHPNVAGHLAYADAIGPVQ